MTLRVEHHPERLGWQWLVLNETHACVAACASEDDATTYANAVSRIRALEAIIGLYECPHGERSEHVRGRTVPRLESRIRALEEGLRGLVEWLDWPEVKGAFASAYAHGQVVSQETSNEAKRRWDNASALLSERGDFGKGLGPNPIIRNIRKFSERDLGVKDGEWALRRARERGAAAAARSLSERDDFGRGHVCTEKCVPVTRHEVEAYMDRERSENVGAGDPGDPEMFPQSLKQLDADAEPESCLLCGYVGERAVWRDGTDIYVCVRCRAAVQSVQPSHPVVCGEWCRDIHERRDSERDLEKGGAE